MTYIIERTTATPFPGAAYVNIVLGNLMFDIVHSDKDTKLETIADFIIDNNNILIKSDIRTEHEMKKKIESTLDIKLNELLLG